MGNHQFAGIELRKKRDLVAGKTTEKLQSNFKPMLDELELDYRKLYQYTLSDIDKLILSIIGERNSILVNYVRWQRSMFVSREVPKKVISFHLETLREVVLDILSPENGQLVTGFLDTGLAVLQEELDEPEHSLISTGQWEPVAEKYLVYLLEKKRHAAFDEIIPMISDAVTMKEVYSYVLVPVQREIGRLWQLNRISVAEEHYATEITRQIMIMLSSRVQREDHHRGKIISTCLGGELHDLGMRMVNDFLSIEGYSTYYTGANTPAVSIVQWLSKDHFDLLAISAALTSHLRMVRESIEKIRSSGFTDIPVLVGGYAFQDEPDLWKIVGADGYAPSAEEAVIAAGELIGRQT